MDWLKIPLPRCIPVSTCRWCDEWVQVAQFGSEVALFTNRKEFVLNYDLEYNDTLEFKIQA